MNGKNGRLYDKFRNRLMLPVIDVRGDVVGFGSRVLDKSEPKYMNTPETLTYSKRRILYGMNLAKKSKRSNIILCEGNLDVVTLHQAGFDNAVASMGTALTQEQLRLLSRYTKELVLCYDNDNAGQQATRRALELLNNSEFSVKVLQLPRRLVDRGVYQAGCRRLHQASRAGGLRAAFDRQRKWRGVPTGSDRREVRPDG